MKKTVWLVLGIIVTTIAIISPTACHLPRKTNSRETKYPHVPVNRNQLVIWKKPSVSDADFKKWLKDSFPNASLTAAFCADCDSSLVLLTWPNITSHPTGQTASSGSSGAKPPPTGDEGPAFYSFNFPMIFSDTVSTRFFRGNEGGSLKDSPFIPGAISPIVFNPGAYSKGKVTVAVFDTGVDSVEMKNYLYQNNNNSCLGTGTNNGWNFFSHNANWKDDYPTRHGSVIARFIEDQGNAYGNNIVNVLPVKIHSNAGVSNLYDILCALQYAKNRKANIINASFGYYSPRAPMHSGQVDSSTILFKNFLVDYFNNNPVLMIAAAGNMDDANENIVYPTGSTTSKRNLDSVNFFPASFARDMSNVIAVTTVSESAGAVSPHQNFSGNVVDIGVDADITSGAQYLFWNPRDALHRYTVEGSSFATPVVTGKIAANFYLIQGMLSSGTVDKTALLNTLAAQGLWHSNAAFTNKINNKRVMKIPR